MARGNTSWDIVILALAVTLIPPTLLILVEAALLPVGQARRWVHLAFVALLTAAFALQTLKELFGGRSAVLLPLAIAIGVLGGLAYARTRVAPAMLTVLAPAPLLILFLFLVVSPVSKLVFPSDSDASARTAVRSQTPVVFVILDELSIASMLDDHGRIDAGRFPGFARLAGSGTWFRNATTVADETTRAVPALLTGQLVHDDKALPIAADHPDNLFTLLRRDYAFDVHEAVTRLCRGDKCHEASAGTASDRLSSLVSDLTVVSLHHLLPRDLESGLAPVDRTFGGFGNAKSRGARGADQAFRSRDQTFDSFVRGLTPATRPTLHFLHIELPHIPYEYLPSGQRYPLANGTSMAGLALDTWVGSVPVRNAYQRYLLQLSYADHLIGRMQARMRATGLWRRALVVVAADHGVSFRPGGRRRRVAPGSLADIAGVPLFVKAPGQDAGAVNDGRARTVDVVPTIAGALGIRLPWRVDGHSLLAPGGPARGRVEVEAKGGSTVATGFARYRRLLRVAAARLERQLGASGSKGSLYAMGPDGRLVGRMVASLPAAPPLRSGFELDSPSSFADVDPTGPTVPALITGTVPGGDAGDRLAVALGGRIVATTEAFRDAASGSTDPPTRFLALAAPDSFRRGRNAIRLYRIDGAVTAPRLAPLQGSGEVRLEDNSVVLADGHRVAFSDGVKGVLEAAVGKGSSLSVTGWAVDDARRRVPDRILVFADGRLVGSGRPGQPRPDVAKDHGAAFAKAGFRFQVASDRARELGNPARLRVVAVSGNRAAVLDRLGG